MKIHFKKIQGKEQVRRTVCALIKLYDTNYRCFLLELYIYYSNNNKYI